MKDPNIRVPFQKGKINLDIFTFSEPTKNVSHEDKIQETPIDIPFEDLFAEELMCLDEPTRDLLIDCTSLGENVDLSFEELYGDELEFLNIRNEEVQNKKSGDENFFSEDCNDMRKKQLKKVKLGMPRAPMTIQLASQLCPIKRTHWNDGKRARGIRPKEVLGSGDTSFCTFSL